MRHIAQMLSEDPQYLPLVLEFSLWVLQRNPDSGDANFTYVLGALCYVVLYPSDGAARVVCVRWRRSAYFHSRAHRPTRGIGVQQRHIAAHHPGPPQETRRPGDLHRLLGVPHFQGVWRAHRCRSLAFVTPELCLCWPQCHEPDATFHNELIFLYLNGIMKELQAQVWLRPKPRGRSWLHSAYCWCAFVQHEEEKAKGTVPKRMAAGTEPGRVGILRKKLLALLETSVYYVPETILTEFPFDELLEERAVLLSRIGQHSQVWTAPAGRSAGPPVNALVWFAGAIDLRAQVA